MNFFNQYQSVGQGVKAEKLALVDDIRSLTIWDCFFMFKMLESYTEFNPSDYVAISTEEDETEGDGEDVLFTYSVEEQQKLLYRLSEIINCLNVDDFRRGDSRRKFEESERERRLKRQSRGWANREIEQEKAMREKKQDGNE